MVAIDPDNEALDIVGLVSVLCPSKREVFDGPMLPAFLVDLFEVDFDVNSVFVS